MDEAEALEDLVAVLVRLDAVFVVCEEDGAGVSVEDADLAHIARYRDQLGGAVFRRVHDRAVRKQDSFPRHYFCVLLTAEPVRQALI